MKFVDKVTEITTNGRLDEDNTEGLLLRLTGLLRMPKTFPQIMIDPHESRSDWISITTPFEFTPEALAQYQLLPIFAEAISRDIGTLITHGNKASEDPFLTLMDGLRVRTSWPKRFAISNRVEVKQDIDVFKYLIQVQVTVHFAVIEYGEILVISN